MESGKAAAPLSETENLDSIEIIRVALYHRRVFDLAVARTNPRDHEKVRSSLLRPIPETKYTPMMNSSNTFWNAARLKIYGN